MAKLSQAELLHIFKALKKELMPYEKGDIKARTDIEGKYDLWVEKEKGMMVFGKIRKECFFSAIMIQSGYVGFHYMPIYGSDTVRGKLDPELLKLLKGKACFHIKSADPKLMKLVKDALEIGYKGYKKMGWI
jgi:hypothetical protein